ncbi:hypothetical protein HanRHA438_Chr02g0050361 [Helianthus annuus]|uniref:Uncharacterized protein n=1 Tax=Helianthus annuus TaxID=4232 RepID=A0A251VDK0_HELAN|nr:hypothetical protein HanXRQr2_Chr02g0049261 [Helianthus annuus]KAJ0938486.1 hypothetical protein HanRHA438_Chr02g0050361 [Helianthus annuus]
MEIQKQNMLQGVEKDLVGDKGSSSSGKMGAPLFSWPWQNLGSLKYLFFGPLLVDFMYSNVYKKRQSEYAWCMHVIILSSLRGLVHQLWNTFFFFFERQIWITDVLLEYHRATSRTTRSYPSPLGNNAYTPIQEET